MFDHQMKKVGSKAGYVVVNDQNDNHDIKKHKDSCVKESGPYFFF